MIPKECKRLGGGGLPHSGGIPTRGQGEVHPARTPVYPPSLVGAPAPGIIKGSPDGSA